jgi:hypothetical protein
MWLQQAMSNLAAVMEEMQSNLLTCDPINIQQLQCWYDKLDGILYDLREATPPESGFCEHCGPMCDGRRFYPKDGTYWCELCFLAEGWEIPRETSND